MLAKIDFYNIDNGYFGNIKKKVWLRITKNDLQLGGKVIKRDGDRLKTIGVKMKTLIKKLEFDFFYTQ